MSEKIERSAWQVRHYGELAEGHAKEGETEMNARERMNGAKTVSQGS